MEIIIEIDENNLVGIHFEKENETVGWLELTRDEQLKILNALSYNYALFCKFLKNE